MANIVQYNDWLEEEVRGGHKIANTFYVLEQLVYWLANTLSRERVSAL
jgi:hypothetical protein